MTDEGTRFPFNADDDDDDDDDVIGGQGGNATIKELRRRIREQNKALKEAQTAAAELEELRTFKAEREQAERTASLKDVFTGIGLSEAQIGLYPADAATDADAVKSWASQYGLVSTGTETESADDGSDKGFVPVSAGLPRGGSGGKMSRADWIKLQQEGRLDEAQAAFREGRVDMSDLGGKYAS